MFFNILEYQLDSNQEFMYGYHSSQIDVYTLYDSKRFINIIIPGIRTIFQLIVTLYYFAKNIIINNKICNIKIKK